MQQPGQPQKSGIDIVVQGRIVWGGVKQQIKKVYGTQTPAINPKTNEQIIEWAFGLAIPKPSPQSNQHEVANFQTIWNAICSEGARLGFQQPGTPGFHWKFDDGDGRKPDGSAFPEHSRGCIVVACKTRIPLKLMAWENGKCVQVTEDQIKCGDYVQVALNIEAHGNPNAGLYVNPSFVARFAYGEAIVNQVDPTTIFGNTPPPTPFGGSASPMGGGFMQAPGFGAGPSAQPGSFGGSGMAAPTGQQQQAPAHYGVLPGQFNPATQQQTTQVPGGMTYGQPNAAGQGMPQAPQQQQVWQAPQGQPMMGNGFVPPAGPGQMMGQPNQPAAGQNFSNPTGPWQPPTGYNGQ